MNVQTEAERIMRNRNKVVFGVILTLLFGTGFTICSNKEKDNDKYIKDIVIEEQESYNIEVVESGVEEAQFVVNEEIIVEELESSSEIVSYELLQFPQLSDEDIYYLKKIATCEANDIENMQMTMLVVLNRVKSPKFPNTVYEVITQHSNGKYQFSVCRPGSTWYRTEPNEKSDEAFNQIWDTLYDYSDGALFFESYSSAEKARNSWFGTLDYLFEVNGVRYYK